MITVVYVKVYSADEVYDFLDQTVNYSKDECMAIYSTDGTAATSFYLSDIGKKDHACGLVAGNAEGSYLTMISAGGLMFGIINIIGNFGTASEVFEVLGYFVCVMLREYLLTHDMSVELSDATGLCRPIVLAVCYRCTS